MGTICQQHRYRPRVTVIRPTCSKIIGLPSSQGAGNFKLLISATVTIGCDLFSCGIIDVAPGITTAGGAKDIPVCNLRHKGNPDLFSQRHIHIYSLIQFYGVLCRFSTSANMSSVFALGENMITVCQPHRDHSTFAGIFPPHPKIIGLPSSQGTGSFKLAIFAVVV